MSRMTSTKRRRPLFCLCAVLALSLNAAIRVSRAQDTEPPPATPTVITEELIQSRLKEAEATEGLDEVTKPKVQQLYQQARAELQTAQEWAAKIAEYDRMIAGKDDKMKEVVAELAKSAIEPIKPPSNVTRTELEQMLKDQQALLTEEREKAAKLQAEPSRRLNRLIELPKEAEAAQKNLATTEKNLQAPAPQGEHPQLTLARQTFLQAQRQKFQNELTAYEKEKTAYSETTELLAKQRDLAPNRVAAYESNARVLQQAMAELVQSDVDAAVDEVMKQLAPLEDLLETQGPLKAVAQQLKPIAEQTLNYALQNQKLVGRLREVSGQLQEVQAALDKTKADYKRTRDRVSNIGLTDALGVMLRSERDALVNLRKRFPPQRGLRSEIRSLHLELLELDDLRADLAVLDDDIERLANDIEPELSGAALRRLKNDGRNLLDAQRSRLDALTQNQRTLFDKLVSLDSASLQLSNEIAAYNAYIEERILWIRSTQLLSLADLRKAADAAVWLINPLNWHHALGTLRGDAVQNWFLYVLGGGAWMALVIGQRRLRNGITADGDVAIRATCHTYLPTLRAAAATFFVAAVWPSLMFVVGWRLWGASPLAEFGRAIGGGLMVAALLYFGLELLRQVLRNKGLAQAHFDWTESARLSFRRHLRWFMTVATPLTFVVVTLQQQPQQDLRASLGRMCCIALLLSVTCFSHFVFRPSGVFFAQMRQEEPAGWTYRTRHFWYLLLVVGPLVLVVMAAIGFYYTTIQTIYLAQATIWVIAACYLLMALAVRGLLVRRRDLALQQAQQRREAARAAAAAGHPSEAEGITVKEEQGTDLTEVSQQNLRLLRLVTTVFALIALFAIWSDLLPALKILNSISLWRVSVAEHIETVTLGDLILSILVIVILVVGLKNMPGLLELLLLQRLPLDAGARYAVTMIFRYILAVVGFVVALSFLHIQWSHYGWLIAAATVGLGFGLQEIFANFVSGLIILLERPIRVGDVVTVGDVTGVVSRIQMRATTVTNWDRQELVVPNKEFVTGRLLNWTLSNQVTRVVINVGVAYGSDTELVHSTLLRIAAEHSNVLPDPAPTVTFDQFADSSLNFVLRCYLPNLERRLATINELHMTIDREFRKAGIEIAFPQRDLHVRTLPDGLAMKSPPANGEAQSVTTAEERPHKSSG